MALAYSSRAFRLCLAPSRFGCCTGTEPLSAYAFVLRAQSRRKRSRGGLAASKFLEVKGGKLLSHGFEPGGKVEYHRKDLGIALAAGREHGAALPVTAVVDQLFGALIAKGRGGWDHSALITLVEEWSGSSGS